MYNLGISYGLSWFVFYNTDTPHKSIFCAHSARLITSQAVGSKLESLVGRFVFKGWFMNYARYMQSDEWAITRRRVISFWDNRCAICGNTENVQVHHRTYQRLGNEYLNDLIPLCDNCHALYHQSVSRTQATEHISEVLARIDYKVRCNNG